MWQGQWEQVVPFFSYPPAARKIIYTTDAIDSLHMQLKKIIKNRGHFPNDDAAVKLLYLALKKGYQGLEDERTEVEVGHESIRDPLRRSVLAAIALTHFTQKFQIGSF